MGGVVGFMWWLWMWVGEGGCVAVEVADLGPGRVGWGLVSTGVWGVGGEMGGVGMK